MHLSDYYKKRCVLSTPTPSPTPTSKNQVATRKPRPTKRPPKLIKVKGNGDSYQAFGGTYLLK